MGPLSFFRNLFLLDEIEATEQAMEMFPQQEAPPFPNIINLPLKRMGNGHGRTPEHPDQVLMIRTEKRLGIEEIMESLHDFRVGCLSLKGFIIEELKEG
jgi:hypothetical protein